LCLWKVNENENRINRRLRPTQLLLLRAEDQQLLLTRNGAAFSADFGPLLPHQPRNPQSPLAPPLRAAAARNADAIVPSTFDCHFGLLLHSFGSSACSQSLQLKRGKTRGAAVVGGGGVAAEPSLGKSHRKTVGVFGVRRYHLRFREYLL
jgi:hypothetical protein